MADLSSGDCGFGACLIVDGRFVEWGLSIWGAVASVRCGMWGSGGSRLAAEDRVLRATGSAGGGGFGLFGRGSLVSAGGQPQAGEDSLEGVHHLAHHPWNAIRLEVGPPRIAEKRLPLDSRHRQGAAA